MGELGVVQPFRFYSGPQSSCLLRLLTVSPGTCLHSQSHRSPSSGRLRSLWHPAVPHFLAHRLLSCFLRGQIFRKDCTQTLSILNPIGKCPKGSRLFNHVPTAFHQSTLATSLSAGSCPLLPHLQLTRLVSEQTHSQGSLTAWKTLFTTQNARFLHKLWCYKVHKCT